MPLGKLYAEKNVFPSLFPQWGSSIKVVGFFLKCRRVFTSEVLHADCQTWQEKKKISKAGE